MKTFLYGIAALPLLATVSFAQPLDTTAPAKQPMQLSENQMDHVTAGWSFLELTNSNTSTSMVSVYQSPSNTISCTSCYLSIQNPALSVVSLMKGGLPASP